MCIRVTAYSYTYIQCITNAYFFCHSDASDYVEITSSNNPLVSFTSDRSTNRQCFNVTIVDDGNLEDTERFSLGLTLGSTTVEELLITVDPNVSLVEIVDEDGKSRDSILCEQ